MRDASYSIRTCDLPQRLADKAVREADDAIRKQHISGIFGDGDPNHPKYNGGINYITGLPVSLFGYETDEFMQKQYKGHILDKVPA